MAEPWSLPRSLCRAPVPALAPLIASLGYYRGEFSHGRERSVPSGQAQLLINLDADRLTSYDEDGLTATDKAPGAALAGASGSPAVIDPAEQRDIICVSFRPGGAYPFFAAPASATSGQLTGLDLLWDGDGGRLRERLLAITAPEDRLRSVEDALLAHAVRPLTPEPALRHAVAALHRGVPVAAVAGRLGLAPKRFVRYFTERVGLTPKRFARVRRLQRTLTAIAPGREPDWAALAAQSGYFDQAHLIRDFRELAGLTPGRYQSRGPGAHNHIPL